jgi:hypothetical protein
MPSATGFNRSLSLPRRFAADFLHFAGRVPSACVERRMHLADVVAVRAAAEPRPSWCSIFTKAYAEVAAASPPLRQLYLPLPWPRLYQHPENIACVAVERRFGDDDAVFLAPLPRPEDQSLTDLDAVLRRYREQPLECIDPFRRALLLSRLPWPMRRWLWRLNLDLSGRRRAHFLGTFAVNVLAGLGAAPLAAPTLLTTTLSYGVLDADGSLVVRLSHDGRVLDGGTAARALAHLERLLHHEIVAELRYLQGLAAA